jgi:Tfp pilus assembly protein PilN
VLRSNLSTRPFYNERAVHLLIGAAALVVLGLTVLNVVRVVSLSRHNTQLQERIGRERDQADRLTQQAASTRKTLNADELDLVVLAAREANTLIDQRTFSWTAFFNQIEATIPPDVMLTSVRPSIKAEETRVAMVVMGRRPDDIDEFTEKLEATGAFENVVVARQDSTEQGMYRAHIESIYVATHDEEAQPESPPPAKPSATNPNTPPPASTPQRGGRQ